MAVPSIAASSGTINGSFTLTLTLGELNLDELNGNGTCAVGSSTYGETELNAISLTVPNEITTYVNVKYSKYQLMIESLGLWAWGSAPDIEISGTATLSSKDWSDGTYLITYGYSISYDLGINTSFNSSSLSRFDNIDVSIEAQPESLTSYDSKSYDYSKSTITSNVTFSPSEQNQTVSSWTVNGATAKTPEPAAATLSLLALAGLAARRRRK